MTNVTASNIWLAADYHFAAAYSCRMPLSSMNSARSMPTPGPATVRLALLRTGIELFGKDFTQRILFPTIRTISIRIRPPEQVAFSNQPLHAYKGNTSEIINNSIVYRAVAHAVGPMSVYLHVPEAFEVYYRELLMAIGLVA